MGCNVLADCREMLPSQIVNTILKNRGIRDIKHFINPEENDLIPYSKMENITKVSDLIIDGIKDDKRFFILWDSDTDGQTSGAIITRYLWNFQIKPLTGVDTGKKHGLDPSEFYWNDILQSDIIIVVDSLDSTIDHYKELYSIGKKVIVLDHHNIDPSIPYDQYVTLVSSMRDSYPNHELSGAGVTWKVCKFIDSQLGTNFADELVDLAATGILADVMDVMNYENRYIIMQGLTHLNNLFLKRLTKGYPFNSTAVLFSCAPAINSANRLNKNNLIMKCFLCDDDRKLLTYNKVIKMIKEEQDKLVTDVLNKISDECIKQQEDSCIICVCAFDYGIAGLIAQNVLAKYQKPAIILRKVDNQYLGSQRSKGIDLAKVINDSGMAVSHGHNEASGVELKEEDLDTFVAYMKKHTPKIEEDSESAVDAVINLDDATGFLAEEIEKIQFISGKNFKPPVFVIEDIEDYSIETWKDGKHLLICPNKEFTIVDWNTNHDIEDFEDHAVFGDAVECIGTLQKASFHGHCWMIANKIEVE